MTCTIEDQIRQEVDKKYPFLTSEERESIIQSRVKLLNQDRPSLIKVDLGENASKKIKDNLFE